MIYYRVAFSTHGPGSGFRIQVRTVRTHLGSPREGLASRLPQMQKPLLGSKARQVGLRRGGLAAQPPRRIAPIPRFKTECYMYVAGTAAGGKLGEGLLEISALDRKK